jgi:glycosyltransferase involved in cell wall biosynthesis
VGSASNQPVSERLEVESIRVLNCITGLNIGGAEYMLARYAKGLENSPYRVSVLSLLPPGPLLEHLMTSRIDVQSLDMLKSRPNFKSLRRLKPSFRTMNPHLVHGWMYHGNVAASIGAWMDRRQPVIWSVHHSLNGLGAEKRMTRWVIALSAKLSRYTAAISYCSKVSAAQHESIGFDASKSCVIPNGIDCEEFQPRSQAASELRALIGVPAERMIVGNVARAHPMKDHANFVKTIGLLRQNGHDVQGLIIGEGHQDGVARDIARKLGIDAFISTPGPRSDVHRLMPGLDVYLLSSSWGEAFPLSVAEAMACGVPAVAADVGDCRWLVCDPALIAAPNDEAALAQAVTRVLSLSKDERTELGQKARARITENFSLQNYISKHVALYEDALGVPVAGSAR